MGDLALGTDGDLDLVNGDLYILDGAEAVRQYLSSKLRMLFGEWFLDQSVGVPYVQQIFDKIKDVDAINSIFKKEIMECPGVKELLAFSLDLDSANRKLTLQFVALTVGGEIDFSETFG